MKRKVGCLVVRLVFGMFFLLLQLSWMLYRFHHVSAVSSLCLLLDILSILVALCAVNRESKSYTRVSWIFLILALPILGIPAYLFSVRDERKEHYQKQFYQTGSQMIKDRKKEAVREELKNCNMGAFFQSKYIAQVAGYPLCREQDSTYFGTGEDAFVQILEDIRSARKYIYLEFYIFKRGKMLDAILELLEQKTAEGVQVRVIYDWLGCFCHLPAGYRKKWKEKGIDMVGFQPRTSSLSGFINYRDHRKILVVDGRIAYTGGFNLADEYINETTRFGYWKDEAVRITGDGARVVAVMFLNLWRYLTGDGADGGDFCPRLESVKCSTGEKGFVQPFSVSPFAGEAVSENIYLNMIRQARKYVYIFTPYLIIGDEMERALISAAKCGVDVRIVAPGIPDKKLIYLLTQYNFSSLIRGGVKVYQYMPGFLHSKCVLADDKYAVIGSINFDYRSFHLLYESGVFLYRASAVSQLKDDMIRTFKVSREVPLSECQKPLFFHRLVLGILRLFSPLL